VTFGFTINCTELTDQFCEPPLVSSSAFASGSYDRATPRKVDCRRLAVPSPPGLQGRSFRVDCRRKLGKIIQLCEAASPASLAATLSVRESPRQRSWAIVFVFFVILGRASQPSTVQQFAPRALSEDRPLRTHGRSPSPRAPHRESLRSPVT